MTTVHDLLDRDVVIPCPSAVEIGSEVDPDRIAPGVVIHAGSRILGARTSIGTECEIGGEGPATVQDCLLGNGVVLQGGFFSGSVFLDGSRMGSGAHVRPGTLLEEQASGAHAVGFKQTVLFPFVTAGSLVNFCDVLMAGGTSREDHSEIGSSYVHFNFTAHGDKATASLLGDVPRGVMLDQQRIFLGGQGGLIGPARLEFGCVTPAGVVLRRDALAPEQLALPETTMTGAPRPYTRDVYGKIAHKVENSLIYIGNIRALQAWYSQVRKVTMDGDAFASACRSGAEKILEDIVTERINRLHELAEKMPHSIQVLQISGANDEALEEQSLFVKNWMAVEAALAKVPADTVGAAERDVFLKEWTDLAAGRKHTEALAEVSVSGKQAGTAWLQAIVDAVSNLWRP